MSLILDALKKLEQERKPRQAGKVNLRPAVTGKMSTPPPPPPWRLPLLFLGVIILAVVATLATMGLFSHKTLPVASPPTQARGENTPSPAPPLPSPLPTAAAEPEPPAVAPIPAPAKRSLPTPKRPKNLVPKGAGPSTADFQVTGIAWLEERAARRAVINGALLGEGALVDGAKIVEIRQDQIRFSRDGRTFAVFIASANR